MPPPPSREGQAAYGYKFMDMLGDMGLMMEIYNEGLMSDRRNASEAACLAEPDAIILEKVNHIGVVVADAPDRRPNSVQNVRNRRRKYPLN